MEPEKQEKLKEILVDFKRLKSGRYWPSAASLVKLLDRVAIIVEGEAPPPRPA